LPLCAFNLRFWCADFVCLDGVLALRLANISK
jgi:hypothetical protein